MSENSHNTKRIVKNTLVLYVRMVVIMLITLYTSRIVLQALGVEDFGLYNVVGGIVAFISFLRSSLTSATQRFLSYELGRKEGNRSRDVFSMCLTTHFLIALVILILGETLGLWFLNTYIQIPEGREVAANWVYQFSLFSLVISVITVPWHACTISHEKMAFFAVVSILDAVLKLFIAFAIMWSPSDKLILYGLLMAVVHLVNLALYMFFCRRHFAETKYKLFFEKDLFLRIFSFSGWTIVGQFAIVGSAQGKSILINIFHSVAANAAMGVAQQVNTAITSLTSNFQMAFQPQITKSYAAKDNDYMKSIMYAASKISFFLLFVVSLPIMLNITWILNIWLTVVPDNTAVFCVLFIIASILNAVGTPLWIGVFATGRIKYYQIAMSIAYLTELTIIYILFRMGFPAVTAMVVKVFLNIVVVGIRLLFANREIESFSGREYLKKVVLPILLSTGIVMIVVLPLVILKTTQWQKLGLTLVVIVVSLLVSYFVGLTKPERKSVKKLVFKFKKK